MTINIDKKALISRLKNHVKISSHENTFSDHKHAAVLVPIITEATELRVLFTRRTMHLHNHPGQISFPGGMQEAIDQTLVDTALRETEEEVGLIKNQIQIVAKLNSLISSTQFLVTPFVGLITPPLDLRIDHHEVAEVFTAPLNLLLDPQNQTTELHAHKSQVKEVYVIQYQNHRIWGLTAKILVDLANLLGKKKGEPCSPF